MRLSEKVSGHLEETKINNNVVAVRSGYVRTGKEAEAFAKSNSLTSYALNKEKDGWAIYKIVVDMVNNSRCKTERIYGPDYKTMCIEKIKRLAFAEWL